MATHQYPIVGSYPNFPQPKNTDLGGANFFKEKVIPSDSTVNPPESFEKYIAAAEASEERAEGDLG